MKILLICLCSLVSLAAASQTVLTRSYAVKPGEKVELHFDYPKTVKVSTWDKNEVSVVAHVDINDGENDSAFVLQESHEGGTVIIKNKIIDMDKLPHRYTVYKDGKKTVYNSKEAYKTLGGSGGATMTSEGPNIEITVEVKVPANTSTNIKSVYGMVEMVNFNAPATVTATYGGIDATLSQANTGKLTATTHYGRIFTNLDLKLTEKQERDFYTSITAEPGKGPSYVFQSTYGKIYLRKP